MDGFFARFDHSGVYVRVETLLDGFMCLIHSRRYM